MTDDCQTQMMDAAPRRSPPRQYTTLVQIREKTADVSVSLKKSSSENGLLTVYRKALLSANPLARHSAGLLQSQAREAAGGSATRSQTIKVDEAEAEALSSMSDDPSPSAFSNPSTNTPFESMESQDNEPQRLSQDIPGGSSDVSTSPRAQMQQMQQVQQVFWSGIPGQKPGLARSASPGPSSHATSNLEPVPKSDAGGSGGGGASRGGRASGESQPRRIYGGEVQVTNPFPRPGTGKQVQQLFRAKTSALASMYCPEDSSDEDTEEETKRITSLFRSGTSHHRSNSLGSAGKDPVLSLHSRSATSNSMDSATEEALLEAGSMTESQIEDARRRRGSYHLNTSQAAVELFLRLNHARQTLDFVKRQASSFAMLDKSHLSIWDALDQLNQLREYEAAMGQNSMLEPELPLRDHAFQTAELCRLAYPDTDWMHLVGLIHGLGKLLAHRNFGSQPQWAICGESFPVGCRFDPGIQGAQFFTANPDRRRKQYNSPVGIYQPHCGLKNVFMSWSAAEYLYLMLLLNGTWLPVEALFLISVASGVDIVSDADTDAETDTDTAE
eukprot:gene14293-20270_t